MAKRDRHGHLQVSEAGHDGGGFPLGDFQQAGLQAHQFGQDMLNGVAQIEAQIGGNLIIPRASGVQFFASFADQRGQSGLDIHVYVFKADRPCKVTGFYFLLDLVEPLQDLLTVSRVQNAGFGEHAGVGARTLDVITVEALVKADRRCKGFDKAVGGFAKASSPGFFRCRLFRHDASWQWNWPESIPELLKFECAAAANRQVGYQLITQALSQAGSRQTESGGQPPVDSLFLPSFCDIRLVFGVVVIAELLAFVIVLANPASAVWNRLGLVSLFVQWVALSGAAVLCLSRPVLARLSNMAAAMTSYLLLLLVTVLISEISRHLMEKGMLAQQNAAEHAAFLLRNLAVSAIISALLLRYLYVSHQWKQQIQAEAQARLDALQARIRPHFLFNSMNSIAALISVDPPQAEQAVQDLSDLFRVTLRQASERVTLEEEIDVAHRYLRLEKLRLGDRLEIQWHITTLPLQRKVPSLILQPLLENAVYHGIEPLAGGGVIHITGCVEGPRIRITVRNPRPTGRGPESRQGNRIALKNIRLRLQLAFGGRAGVALRELDDVFEASMYFPREKAR